jgi:hypothetical protein
LRWDESEVMEALAIEAHVLTQEQGIEALKKMEISREIERRGTPKHRRVLLSLEAREATPREAASLILVVSW